MNGSVYDISLILHNFEYLATKNRLSTDPFST